MELCEKSPSERGGEEGSGSESGSEAKGSSGNLQTAAIAKLGSSIQQRGEQEGQGLGDTPTATVPEDKIQNSDPSVPPSVEDTEDTAEDEEDPLAVGSGRNSPKQESATLIQENGSRNQAEVGSGDQGKPSLQTEPHVEEHQTEAVSENGSGGVDVSGNGSQSHDAGGGLEEVADKACTLPEQSHEQEQGTGTEENSTIVPQPVERKDNCSEAPAECPHAGDGGEEGTLAEEKKEYSILPPIAESSEAAVEKHAEFTGDVEVVEEGKKKVQEREEKATASAELEEREGVPEEKEVDSSPAEYSPSIASRPTVTLQSSSLAKNALQESSQQQEIPQSASTATKNQQNSSQLKGAQESASEPEEMPQNTSPAKELQPSGSPPKKVPEGSSVLEAGSSPSSLPQGGDAPLLKETEHSGSSSQDTQLSVSQGSNSAPAEVKGAVANQEEGPPPPDVGERVFVETASGLKMGVVKFVGETQFQPGLWIGVALERATGEWYDVVCHVMSHDSVCPFDACVIGRSFVTLCV